LVEYALAFDALVRGGGYRRSASTFRTEKTRMAWLPDGDKFEDTFIRFDRMYERDRQTDRRTSRQTLHDDIGRAYASHRAAKRVQFFSDSQCSYR